MGKKRWQRIDWALYPTKKEAETTKEELEGYGHEVEVRKIYSKVVPEHLKYGVYIKQE